MTTSTYWLNGLSLLFHDFFQATAAQIEPTLVHRRRNKFGAWKTCCRKESGRPWFSRSENPFELLHNILHDDASVMTKLVVDHQQIINRNALSLHSKRLKVIAANRYRRKISNYDQNGCDPMKFFPGISKTFEFNKALSWVLTRKVSSQRFFSLDRKSALGHFRRARPLFLLRHHLYEGFP